MFPPEIIDHILSFLQWDHVTLKVCARAHPSLSSLVKKHFYRHLAVQSYDPGAYYPSDLLKLFVDEPNIANYVRSLRIHVLYSRCYQALESILPMLTQLRVILLSSAPEVVWDNLPESFRTAFVNCLLLPTLTRVRVSFIDGFFPLSALDHSILLKRLSLGGDFSYLPPAPPLVHPPLDFLDLSNCSSESMESIASWVESRGVHSLRLCHRSKRSSRLVEVCANTLTTLHLDVSSHYGLHHDAHSNNPTSIPLSLSYLPQLARLTVHAPIFFQFSCLPTTMHLLDTLPSPPTNLVLLVISVGIKIGTSNTLDDISNTDWSSLISFPYFDVIPKVELRVRAHKSGTYIPSVELLGGLKQDPDLMQLEMHQSFVINAVEEPDDDGSWFKCFYSD